MTSKKTREADHVDQGWAWVILIASTSIILIVQGNVRSFGIFLVEYQKEFESSSATISSILSVEAISNCISAFLVLNCLSRFLQLRVLVIIGGLSSALCFILDSQLTKIEIVTFSHVFTGIGTAFIYGPTIVIIGHYFVKYRGTANALTSCGASVGQFAFSPLFSYLISEYGFRGALLLKACTLLQCITFAMLLRPTSFFVHGATKTIDPKEENSLIDKINNEKNRMIDTEKENEHKIVQLEMKPNTNGTLSNQQLKPSPISNDVKKNSTEEIRSIQDIEKNTNLENSKHSKSEIIHFKHDSNPSKKSKNYGCNFGRSILSILKTLFTNVDFKLFKKKIFIIYFFGSSISQLASSLPQAFFPSHAEDIGLDRKDGMLFVAIAGFADLGGRILTTLIADRKFLNRSRFLATVLILHGIVACFIPFFHNFQTFAAYCVIYGASGGIVFAISTTILTDFIGIDKLSQGFGLMLFFNGFNGAITFFFIGYLRGLVGSYNLGFQINGASLIVSGILFSTESCIKYEKQRYR